MAVRDNFVAPQRALIDLIGDPALDPRYDVAALDPLAEDYAENLLFAARAISGASGP